MARLSATKLFELIDDRSKTVSIIRLGDGEAGLLRSLKEGLPLWPVTSAAWRYRYLMDQPWQPIAKALRGSISAANVVGTPDPGDKTCSDFREYTQTWQETCSNNVNRIIMSEHCDVLRSWLTTRRVGIFYHDTIMARRRYAAILEIGGGSLNIVLRMIQHVCSFRGDIPLALDWSLHTDIDLALVSGGPMGKTLCVKLAQNGIDALDMGQALDR